ncbi:MAG: HDIG domain-containing protein [Proteobacteria bacterium]|nr:HDIG domain-containing protein [Pseudomonadota bacterium]
MQNGKDKPPSYQDYSKVFILIILSLVLSFVISINIPPQGVPEYRYGDIARENIKSPVDIYIPNMDVTLKKGEIIIREGERVSEEHLSKLSAFKKYERGGFLSIKKFLLLFLLLSLSLTIVYEYADKNIKKFTLSVKDIIFCSVFTLFSIVFVKLLSLIFEYFPQEYAINLFYIIPLFSFGIIMRIVLFSEAAIVFSIVFASCTCIMFDNSFSVFLYTFLGNVLASYFSGKCENRNTILKAGIYSAFIASFIVLLFNAYSGQSFANVPMKIVFILLNGVGSSFIAIGLLPVIEHVFDYTTDVKLLEIANLEHPLLEEMMVEAPGTYHHSIVVGNLCKAAAESIGAHPLLARVSAYYHDIGKLKMPHYFIENRKGFEDAHKSLSPNMSALIILSHVKEGVELAEKYKLGNKIKDIIKEHHGTSPVSFFYNRAKEMEDPSLHVIEEKDFRYAGPKPQTKEAGIVMLADAVEASSRTLDEPTPKRIETHVEDVIENIFLDGQLDECELTLKDLHAIQKSFIAILTGIFHQRIEYPERAEHDSTHKKLSKIPANGQKTSAKNHRRLTDIFRAAG